MSAHPSIAGIRLVLGGNVFGWTADKDASFAILDRFYAAGGRMVDTAECYSFWVPGHSGGESESVIGAWLRSREVRAEMRIATKTNVDAKPGGLRPEVLARQLDASLERLQTDYVDLYYAHRDDPETPQDEVAAGFGALQRAGKLREAGASNFTATRLAGALAAAKRISVAPYGVLQNEYNLVSRAEYAGDLQALCVAHDVAMLPFYSLANGYLTGKYRTEADYAQSVRGHHAQALAMTGAPVIAAMDCVAAETGASLAAIALAWLNAQPGIGAPIASATSVEQLDQLIEGALLELNAEQVDRLTAAFPG